MDQAPFDVAYREAKRLLVEGASPDDLIAHFKSAGASQGLTSVALTQMGVAEEGRCKQLVFDSPHWRENRQANLTAQQAVEQFLDGEEDQKLG